MANWQRTLRLLPEWGRAKAGSLSYEELAAVVAKRLAALRPFNDEYVDEERAEIVEDFEALSRGDSVTSEEFNDAMHRLYDWADTPLDNKFNGKKVCWVQTI